MFSMESLSIGTVIEQAFNSGLLIDLAGAPDNARQVIFDINDGWGPLNVPWLQAVPAGADLVSLLIEPAEAATRSTK